MKPYLRLRFTIVLVFTVMLTIISVPAMAEGEAAQIVARIPTNEKVVAFTFDAGSDAGHTLAILGILDEYDIKATFFLTGRWLELYPELGQAVAAAGHDLGNHSYSHPRMTEIEDDDVLDQLRRTEEKAAALFGQSLRPFFRPPYGAYSEHLGQLVAQYGYDYTIMWTVDSLDWKFEEYPADRLEERVVSRTVPGAIVLMHVGGATHTPEALPNMIERLLDQGYSFVTLSQLLDVNNQDDKTYYTVKPGDTLYSIAQRHGVTVADIVDLNHIENPNTLQVGLMLEIPAEPGTPGPGSGNDQEPPPGSGGDDEPAPGTDDPGQEPPGSGGDDEGPTERSGFWSDLLFRVQEAVRTLVESLRQLAHSLQNTWHNLAR